MYIESRFSKKTYWSFYVRCRFSKTHNHVMLAVGFQKTQTLPFCVCCMFSNKLFCLFKIAVAPLVPTTVAPLVLTTVSPSVTVAPPLSLPLHSTSPHNTTPHSYKPHSTTHHLTAPDLTTLLFTYKKCDLFGTWECGPKNATSISSPHNTSLLQA